MSNSRLLVCLLTLFSGIARAQDSKERASEKPEVAFDYLVDGDLAQDDPANRKFKTLQSACEAAPAGTREKPTVIGIKPNVYQLTGGESGASLNITKNFISLIGLTDDRRTVVLADNRGHAQGAADNGFVLNVNADGFTLKNLTLINYCNVDYAYPGDATKNLVKRSDVITQAVALQAAGDRHVYENVAIISLLDTMFLKTARSYFHKVYIQGTDDFIGGGQRSVWEDCTIVFPMGRGVMSASNIVFRNCKFEATEGLQFYKAEFGSGNGKPVALINCVMPVNSTTAPVAWVRGIASPRPALNSLTYQTKDTAGKPAVINDCTGERTGTKQSEVVNLSYGRELSDREAAAFNPWNILRAAPGGAVDDWDPANAKQKYESSGSEVFRILVNASANITRTEGDPVTLTATVLPERAPDTKFKWSCESAMVSLNVRPDGTASVTGNNTTEKVQYVPITATASNGFSTTAYVLVEPAYVDPPRVKASPIIDPPADGMVSVRYELELGGREDQSLIIWSVCDDAAGANPRDVAVSRGNQPLKTIATGSGMIGKYLKVGVQPKLQFSEVGAAVTAISKNPIAPGDVKGRDTSIDFRSFVTTLNEECVSGFWTVLGKWTVDGNEKGYSARAASVGASLLYQQDEKCGDMQVDLILMPEKTDGQGFGGPGSSDDGDRVQRADLYIKYDPRTRNGYSLRFWRTTLSAQKCMFQLFKIVDGVGTPLNDQQVLSGVFKSKAHVTLKVVGDQFTASAGNDVDQNTLELRGTITPNTLGGAGLFWGGSVPRGNSCSVAKMDISYK